MYLFLHGFRVVPLSVQHLLHLQLKSLCSRCRPLRCGTTSYRGRRATNESRTRENPKTCSQSWTSSMLYKLSRRMGKPTICIGKNKGADQLRSNCEADHRLCFRYMDGKIPLLSKSKISSLYPSSVTVQACLCWTW